MRKRAVEGVLVGFRYSAGNSLFLDRQKKSARNKFLGDQGNIILYMPGKGSSHFQLLTEGKVCDTYFFQSKQ